MKDEFALKQSKRLSHTRCAFDVFNALSEWAVSEAGGKDKVFGTKPGVADYTPTDLGTEAGRAVKSNIANAPDVQAYLEKILPGYGEMVRTGSKNTLALLKGEIPKDVQDSIRRTTAFKSLGGGYAGSPMSRALTARDFGRTSLDLMQEGGNAAQRWAGVTEGANAPFTVTAPAQADATFRNNLYQQITQQQKYNVAAAPDPGAAGIFNLQIALGSMAAGIFGGKASLGTGVGQGGQTQAQNAASSWGNSYAGTYNGQPYSNNNIPTANAVSGFGWGG